MTPIRVITIITPTPIQLKPALLLSNSTPTISPLRAACPMCRSITRISRRTASPLSSYSHPAASTATVANRHANVDQGHINLAPFILVGGSGSHSNNGNHDGNNNIHSNGEHVQPQIRDMKDPQSSNGWCARDEHVQWGDMVRPKSPSPSEPPPQDVRPVGGIVSMHIPYGAGSSTWGSCPF